MTADEDPPRPPPPRAAGGAAGAVPTLGDGIALVLWTFLAQGVVAILVVPLVLAGVDVQQPVVLAGMVMVSQVVTLAGALGWFRLRGRLGWRIMGATEPALRHLLMGVGAGAVGLGLVIGYGAGMERLVGPSPQPQQQILEMITAGRGLAVVLAITAAVAVAPVVEEVVFRGALFQGIRTRAPTWVAITVSALVFALVHIELYVPGVAEDPNLVHVGGLVPLGAWFAGAFHLARSLVVPMVAHAVFNGSVILLSLLGV